MGNLGMLPISYPRTEDLFMYLKDVRAMEQV